ncbi:hypothetical protein [Streptomyces sp. PvR034]|uniref:hypothetical protein n=1 Tax=Streptomyces sp. PvR034 TaxID=3156401 RepID=UPI00339AA4CE
MRSASSSCVQPRASRALRKRAPNAARGELSGFNSLMFKGPSFTSGLLLSPALIAALDALGPGHEPYRDLIPTPLPIRCTLEHTTGPHWALLVDNQAPTALWARWPEGRSCHAVFVRPDCPVGDTDSGAGCSEFQFHPGGHTWQLTDPDHERWSTTAATLY